MMFDRLVFSTEPALTDAQLDALINTDTDNVIQDPGTTFTAFEADGVKATLLAGTPESWASTSDVTASGGTALISSGTNQTATSPHSFAQYSIKFATTAAGLGAAAVQTNFLLNWELQVQTGLKSRHYLDGNLVHTSEHPRLQSGPVWHPDRHGRPRRL